VHRLTRSRPAFQGSHTARPVAKRNLVRLFVRLPIMNPDRAPRDHARLDGRRGSSSFVRLESVQTQRSRLIPNLRIFADFSGILYRFDRIKNRPIFVQVFAVKPILDPHDPASFLSMSADSKEDWHEVLRPYFFRHRPRCRPSAGLLRSVRAILHLQRRDSVLIERGFPGGQFLM
jgi:hypothetical protein